MARQADAMARQAEKAMVGQAGAMVGQAGAMVGQADAMARQAEKAMVGQADAMVGQAEEAMLEIGRCDKCDTVVIVAGSPGPDERAAGTPHRRRRGPGAGLG